MVFARKYWSGPRAVTYLNGRVSIENAFPKSKYQKLLPKGHVHLDNVLFAPLSIDSKTVGTIGLANKPSGFSDYDAKMASAFGKIASVALTNSNMLEMLEEKEKRLRSYNENLEKLVEERTNQLKTSERFAAIGQTASMVGHDIRNPLQSIISELYLAKEELKNLSDSGLKSILLESICNIEHDVGYINKIVQDLQDYTRKITPNMENFDLDELLKRIVFNRRHPENVKISLQVSRNVRKLSTDSALLTRILTNLVNNAIQAMPNGGELAIKASKHGKKAIIAVEDTGSGIPEEVQTKLFTPLFTTKSKGQGLGLAVVKRLTEGLGGSIDFSSEEGKGAKFFVALPI